MRKYRLVAKKGEGTFSEVLKAQNVKDGKYYAIKCMKNRFDSIDQVWSQISTLFGTDAVCCECFEFRLSRVHDTLLGHGVLDRAIMSG